MTKRPFGRHAPLRESNEEVIGMQGTGDLRIETSGQRARRLRRAALERRDNCVAQAMRSRTAAMQSYYYWLADTQQDRADKLLLRY